MAIPDKVECPICKNIMEILKNEKDTSMIFYSVSSTLYGKQVYLGSTIFVCGNCNNVQTFLDMSKI